MKSDTMETYLALLAQHDWNYEYSDDHTAWKRGRDERKRLEDLRYEFDRDYELWNEHLEARKKHG